MIDKPTQETLTLYATADLRVKRSPALTRLRDIILYDWPEGDTHWRWVATAPTAEIVEWAETVENDGDTPVPAVDLSTGGAAALLGVDRRTVTGWCSAGRVEGAYQTPGGHWRVRRVDVEAMKQTS